MKIKDTGGVHPGAQKKWGKFPLWGGTKEGVFINATLRFTLGEGGGGKDGGENLIPPIITYERK